ncbi:MAG: 1-acyl-sn-glycerol-3-phosphate acyltransferase [Bacteroidota bacterium]
MLTALFKLLFKLGGWKVDPNLPEHSRRCVMIAAPHTSNWDFIFTIACFSLMKLPVRYTIKKEWNLPVLGPLIASMGAIWIDRSPKTPGAERPSMVDLMAEIFEQRPNEEIVVLVTPEGSRSPRPKWRTGFYYAAKKAGVPVGLGYLDYGKKIGGVGKVVFPTEDVDGDMKQIMEFYRPIQPHTQEKFLLDERYA